MLRKTVTIDRLLRRSTLQDHATVNALSMPTGEQRVELIKLRQSFEFAKTLDASSVEPDSKPKAIVKTTSAASRGHDILVPLSHAHLVEIQPHSSGWFAVLLTLGPSPSRGRTRCPNTGTVNDQQVLRLHCQFLGMPLGSCHDG